jgi:hypothetical protein
MGQSNPRQRVECGDFAKRWRRFSIAPKCNDDLAAPPVDSNSPKSEPLHVGCYEVLKLLFDCGRESKLV